MYIYIYADIFGFARFRLIFFHHFKIIRLFGDICTLVFNTQHFVANDIAIYEVC